MQPRPGLRALLIVLLAAALAACGGGTAPDAPATAAATPTDAPATEAPAAGAPTPGTSLQACEIVTPADVAAATGVENVPAGTLKETPTSLSPGHTECTYEGDFGRLIVSLTPEDGANLYDAARGSYDDAVDLPGIGDGAFNSDGNNRAFIWKGAVAVMLTVFLAEKEQVDVAKALGAAIVAKL